MLLIVGIGFLALASVAIERGIREFNVYLVSSELEKWERSNPESRESSVAINVQRLGSLVEKYPQDTRLAFMAVKVTEWQAHAQKLSPRTQKKSYARIESMLAGILKHRPFWGRAWSARLLNWSHLQKNWDSTTDLLYSNAMAHGKWDAASVYYLVRFTYQNWSWIPEQQKPEIESWMDQVFSYGGPVKQYIRLNESQFPNVKIRSNAA